jgi:hypothetical protein
MKFFVSEVPRSSKSKTLKSPSKRAVPQPSDGECVCFTISRGPGHAEEKWMEFTDAHSGCQYYHNPKTG